MAHRGQHELGCHGLHAFLVIPIRDVAASRAKAAGASISVGFGPPARDMVAVGIAEPATMEQC